MSNLRGAVSSISAADAARLLRYCPDTGVITRIVATGGQLVGARVGSVRKDGYLSTKIRGTEFLNHRLAWLLQTGSMPATEIDHLNGNRADNRWSNLRAASRSINNQNRRAAHKNNKLGILGVRQVKNGRFLARIRVDGQLRRLGTFTSSEQAHAAYLDAKRTLHQGNTL